MDDDFLYKVRKEPRPEFAKNLYERINQPMTSKSTTIRSVFTWKTALAGVTALLVIAFIVSPSMRAVAQDFLNLFRVKHFAAVTVDPARVAQLEQSKVDIESLIGSSMEVLKEPGKPQLVASAEEASQLAGIPVRTPTQLPDGMGNPEIRVQGEGSVRFKADTAKLQALVDTLGMTDVKIPEQLNGATVTLTKPPLVVFTYKNGKSNLVFVQARNPDIVLPEGVNLAQLGEIALRVVGMNAEDARRLAQSIDWTSTVLIPIPANAATFREVDVRGTSGLLITTDGSSTLLGSESQHQGSVLMWSEGNTVYALSGTSNTTLVDIANSLQ